MYAEIKAFHYVIKCYVLSLRKYQLKVYFKIIFEVNKIIRCNRQSFILKFTEYRLNSTACFPFVALANEFLPDPPF